jgi:plastocyanin domain-containing protein
MNKFFSIGITVGFIFAIGIGLFLWPKMNRERNEINPIKNVEIRDGVQYITINARGGYSPNISMAQANIPTKLVVETNGTYDCSAALVIRSIGYQKILPQTGQEIIDLGTPEVGTLQGLCSMGMYNFSVNFE